PDDASDGPGRHGEGEVVDQHAIAVALARPFRPLDHAAEPGSLRDEDLRRPHLLALVLGEKLFIGAAAGLTLRLSGPRRHVHPFQLAIERPLARGLLLLLDAQPLSLLLEPGGVVALPGNALAAIEL